MGMGLSPCRPVEPGGDCAAIHLLGDLDAGIFGVNLAPDGRQLTGRSVLRAACERVACALSGVDGIRAWAFAALASAFARQGELRTLQRLTLGRSDPRHRMPQLPPCSCGAPADDAVLWALVSGDVSEPTPPPLARAGRSSRGFTAPPLILPTTLPPSLR